MIIAYILLLILCLTQSLYLATHDRAVYALPLFAALIALCVCRCVAKEARR